MALANQKGGVGKTTTAIHLAHGLALAGNQVALLDLDPQGNATVAMQGMEWSEGDEGDGPMARLGVLRPVQPGLWLLPSPGAENAVGRHAEVDVAKLGQLVSVLEEGGIGWLVVDCPPRMDQWGWAGLQLCEEVMVPVQAEFFAMHGLSQMLRTLEEAQAEFAGRGRLMGVLATIVDRREPVCSEVVDDLRRTLGERVFQTVILRDSQFVEAASHGKTVFSHNPTAKGALCYGELIREVVNGGPKIG